MELIDKYRKWQHERGHQNNSSNNRNGEAEGAGDDEDANGESDDHDSRTHKFVLRLLRFLNF